MTTLPKATQAGIAAFLDPGVNRVMGKVLNAWGVFLESLESAVVLGNCSSCWFSTTALREMTAVANVGETAYTWDEIYQCDPDALYHGYQSWDSFFTRPFRDGIRPVASPDNDRVIVHACESRPINIQQDVQARDQFWVKGQPYSVRDLLGHDTLADRFIGGTVYQGFLSSLNYHRWHAPVAGRIIKAYNIPGTYFSQATFTATSNYTDYLDFSYAPTMATRAVIIIQADHPAIGLVAFVGAGMAEVSTCEITVTEGQHVEKGEEIGMFHYGGSTHCLVFEYGVNLSGWPKLGSSENLPVRSQLAVVE
jgi:phosphatidylserine decarboxylase